MRDQVRRGLARPLVGLWLTFSPHSWKRHVIAADLPHVRAAGLDPDRILLVGDGAASGRGVRTHELGLPGFLARSLTARTRRATDVDLLVDDDMTVESCAEAIEGRDLERYDVVVLSIGANEALALMSPEKWEHATRDLVDLVRGKTPSTTKVFLLAIPEFGINPHFPRALAGTVDDLVRLLNSLSERIAGDYPDVVYVTESKSQAFELEGPTLYHRWADAIAARIGEHLPPSGPSRDLPAEKSRQAALERLESTSPGANTRLDEFTDEARRRFGTDFAAVTFIRSTTQLMRSASGLEPVDLPRDGSFCDVTIRTDSVLVIEDTERDERFADYSVVTGDPGIRFYAGCPLVSPDGHRIGALCVMGTRPRHFAPDEVAALRELADRVQRKLYGLPKPGRHQIAGVTSRATK